MTTLEIILSSVLGGGFLTFLLGLITLKYKKKQEQTTTISGEADLTEALLHKYQSAAMAQMVQIESIMQGFEKRQEAAANRQVEAVKQSNEELKQRLEELTARVENISTDVNDIKGFLNGSFKRYQDKKRNEKGQFCK